MGMPSSGQPVMAEPGNNWNLDLSGIGNYGFMPTGQATMNGQAVFTPDSRSGLYNSAQNIPAVGGKGGGGNAAQAAPQPAGSNPPNMFTQAANATNMAMAGAQREMGYQPMMVGYGGYNPSMINASQFNTGFAAPQINTQDMTAAQTQQADIERFYNPYTTQVIDTSMQDIERARQMQSNQAAAQAQAAGAFGGSRGALMEAEIGRNALDQAASTAAQLRSQGFTQAANLAQQDVTRRQQANQLNAQQALQAAITGAQLGTQRGIAGQANALQAMLANQQFGSRAAEFGLNQQQAADMSNQAAMLGGSAQRLAAGNQLANIGNLGFGQGQETLAMLNNAGQQQQNLAQMLINAAGRGGQFGDYTGMPSQSLAGLISAISGVPIPTTTRQSESMGLTQGLQTGASLLSLFGFSDISLKENIEKIGASKGGFNLYKWDWNDKAKELGADKYPEMGVIAQEVMETLPEAVIRGDHGYLMVNYGALS